MRFTINQKRGGLLFRFLFIIQLVSAQSQITISGKITDGNSGHPLSNVTIFVKESKSMAYSKKDGSYKIIVPETIQKIEFRFIGYYAESYKIPKGLTYIIHDLQMLEKKEQLKTLEVKENSKYRQDSIERAQTYRHYSQLPQPQIIDKEAHYNGGFGLVFHPLTYFSKEARRKRKFRKRFQKNEKEAFIDSRYTPTLIKEVTGLKDDSLPIFMSKYRPNYRFTRYATKLELKSWILKQYKKWIRKKD